MPGSAGHFCRWAKAAGEESPSGMLLPAAGAAVAAGLASTGSVAHRSHPICAQKPPFLVTELSANPICTQKPLVLVTEFRVIDPDRRCRTVDAPQTAHPGGCSGNGVIPGPTPFPQNGLLCTSSGTGPRGEITPFPPQARSTSRHSHHPLAPRPKPYFKNTKNTARTRQAKAAMWFQWMGWPLKTNITMMVKTVREITSWITFS